MAHGVGDKNIITMLLIFLTAGSFVGVVGRSSAESVAYFMLTLIPARFSVAVLFRIGSDGNFCRHDHTSGADRGGCFQCVRF